MQIYSTCSLSFVYDMSTASPHTVQKQLRSEGDASERRLPIKHSPSGTLSFREYASHQGPKYLEPSRYATKPPD